MTPTRLRLSDGALMRTLMERAPGAADNGQGNGVWSHARRDPYVTGYFAPRFPDGICPPTADPSDPRGGKAIGSYRWTPAPSATTVSLARVVAAAHADPPAAQGHTTYPADVLVVECALNAEGLLRTAYVDGSFGTLTMAAYAAWQRGLGYSGTDADGIPGRVSLCAALSAQGASSRWISSQELCQ